MANTNNYAEQFSPDLLEILMQGTLTSPFITSNVKWVGARTFHFTQMSTTGFKNHSREGGWNKGKYTQTDVPFTCEHDRDIEFLVDKADVDETNATAKVENISKVFEQTQVAPETDALFFSKVATKIRQQTDIILQQRHRSGLRRTLIQSSKQFSLPANSADTRQEAHLLPM